MQAKIKKVRNVTVVQFVGRVEIENIETLKRNLLDKLGQCDVVFNLQELNFVGSNGITPFVQTMAAYTEENKSTARFCGVSSEFRRVFEATELREIPICENEETAVALFASEI